MMGLNSNSELISGEFPTIRSLIIFPLYRWAGPSSVKKNFNESTGMAFKSIIKQKKAFSFNNIFFIFMS
jgi:hypothetical protein